jgi:ABC-type transport system substrate-binding protein
VIGLLACTNNPYPESASDEKILYTSFTEAPRTLDPAVAYTTSAHVITGAVFETLLQYHYLKRPYALIPGLATDVPEPVSLGNGNAAYRFTIRPGVLYQDDACFALAEAGRMTREVVAADFEFELMRVADPAVNSPVIEPFSNIEGFASWTEQLVERREVDADFAALPVNEQYRAIGPIAGVMVEGRHTLVLHVSESFPQILYWFAMPFTAPLPWEAVLHYDGQEGRDRLADHPVGAGAYYLAVYDKQSRIVLEANPNWYGVRHPEWRAPGTVYPSEGETRDLETGRLDPALVGQSLPFIGRVELRREKEPIPYFNKFLQGYYDSAGVIKESFDKVIHDGGLSQEMRAAGISLEKSVEPSVFYLGFNMEDSVVGAAGEDRARKLRQAMSLVVDSVEYTRLFSNGRGVPAESLIPPGIFGYDEHYRNPYRTVDVDEAKKILRQAGYPDGIDPGTGKPLKLTFDTADTSAQGRLRFEFFVNAWRRLGIDVEIAATNYNQFQEKVRNGAYQIFMWGWVADYPDPENFLFLLWSEMARSKNNGPNTANFMNDRYDELYLSVKARGNGPERMAEIVEMREIVERERPWIELLFREDYALYHSWYKNVKPFGMSGPMFKYRDIDVDERSRLREAWNEPVLWPLYVLIVGFVVLVVPGIVTFMKERQ